jgi:hypothetical protein
MLLFLGLIFIAACVPLLLELRMQPQTSTLRQVVRSFTDRDKWTVPVYSDLLSLCGILTILIAEALQGWRTQGITEVAVYAGAVLAAVPAVQDIVRRFRK